MVTEKRRKVPLLLTRLLQSTDGREKTVLRKCLSTIAARNGKILRSFLFLIIQKIIKYFDFYFYFDLISID